MNKLHLLIDTDGVVFNINKKVIDISNEENNTNYDYKNNTSWWWGDYTKDTNCGSRKYFENMLDREGFFRNAEIIEDSVKYINKLYEEGHEITFISAPHWTNKTFMTDRIEFLKEHFEWFKPEKHLVLTSRKGICDGENRLIIDDYPSNLEQFRKAIRICYGQPYNKDYKGCALRFEKWCEIYNAIKIMKKGER